MGAGGVRARGGEPGPSAICDPGRESETLAELEGPDREQIGARPPRHAHDPPQHRALDRARRATRGEALRLFAELLPDLERVLGRDHPDTLTTRNNIASWTGEVGDAREALRLFTALLPDQERVLGRDHPDTLTTRNNIACWTGDGGRARRCGCSPLLPDWSGCWAATTPTRSRPATTSRPGPARWGRA